MYCRSFSFINKMGIFVRLMAELAEGGILSILRDLRANLFIVMVGNSSAHSNFDWGQCLKIEDKYD